MHKRTQLILVILFSLVLFFLRLGAASVYQVAEARNAECAREMMVRNDWITPVFNGKLRTDKPALEYFAMIAAYRIAGVSEGSARFFSAVCGLLLVIATFLFASRHLGRTAAWWAALCLLASPHLIFQFRLATPDPYLILADTLALYAYYEGRSAYGARRPHGWGWYGAMYALLGVAVLAKGPVGVLLPGLAILAFLILKKEFTWRSIRQLRPWWGLLILGICAAPWYILVHLRTGGAWTRGFFLEHNLHRFDGSMGGHGGIFLLTFAFVAVGMLPFSVFCVQSIRDAWKERKRQSLMLFSVIAFFSVVIFYAVSRTKLINYTVPAYPFLALMTGYWLSRVSAPHRFSHLRIPFVVLGIVTSLLPVAAFIWVRTQPALAGLEWISLCVLLYPAGVWVGYGILLRGNFFRSISVLAAGFMLATMVLFLGPYPVLDSRTPMRKAASIFYPGRPVAAFRRFNNAFVFYARRPIVVVSDTAAVSAFLRTHPDGLILSSERHPEALNSMAGLQEIRNDAEVFNSRPSRIYRRKDITPARPLDP